MKPERMKRINELLKREISELAEKMSIARNTLATVTKVKTTPDLRQAKVFISVFGDDEQKDSALKEFEKYRSEFQRAIAKDVTIKYTPVLSFHLDTTEDNAERIYSILDELGIEDENEDSSKPET